MVNESMDSIETLLPFLSVIFCVHEKLIAIPLGMARLLQSAGPYLAFVELLYTKFYEFNKATYFLKIIVLTTNTND